MNEIDLNELAIKTDSLPDAWKMLLIDPATGLPAKNITVARFIELLINKMPEATETSKGLMSSQNLKSNPSSRFVNRKILNTSGLLGQKSYKIKVHGNNANFNIKILGEWEYVMAYGVLEKAIIYGNNSPFGTKVYKCSMPICNTCYISDPYMEGDSVCVDIVNKNKYSEWINTFAVILECYNPFDHFEFINNQTPREADLTKNNRDETEFAFRTSINTLASSPNVLTDTISENYSILLPPPPQIACQTIQNQQVQTSNLRYSLCRRQPTRMVQFQLKVNQPRCRSSTFGLSTKLEKRYLNCRKKINISNKSSRLTA